MYELYLRTSAAMRSLRRPINSPSEDGPDFGCTAIILLRNLVVPVVLRLARESSLRARRISAAAMSSNPFDDLDDDPELAANPFDVLDQHLPPLPRHAPTIKSSPKLKPAKPADYGAAGMPRMGSGGSLTSLGDADHEFEIQGLPGGSETRPRRGSKDSGSHSELAGSITDPNYVPTDYVLKLLNDVEEDPPVIRFENTAQFKEAIMTPLREGQVHKYQFVYHAET